MPILDPLQLSTQDNYKLMIGSVVPRPIAWVSTISNEGVTNLAPFSFFTGVCSNPLTLCFCPAIRGKDGAKKDTLKNIEANGEFVIHTVSEFLMNEMNISAAEVPPEVSEFELAHLETKPSQKVKPPTIAKAKVAFECKLNQVVPVGPGDVGSGFIVIGTVVSITIAGDAYDNGRIKHDVLNAVGRLAGDFYCRTQDVFKVVRPFDALDK